MARLTAAQIHAALVKGGFTPSAAQTMTAIALAESSGNPALLGDTGIQTSTWGPSFGLFQIRTLKGETGRGTDRDISALTGNIDRQVQAALKISNNGRDFTPWSVFTSGRYRQFLGVASANMTDAALMEPAGLTDKVVNDQLEKVRPIVTEVIFAGLGLGLLAVGISHTFGPQIKAAKSAGLAVATRGVVK